jgi:predicted enzyme related to lactoylglutathione lyase
MTAVTDFELPTPVYPYGAPCWLDLLVSDVPRAQQFYAELFGWTWLAGDPASGGYTLALLDGKPVAGVSRKPSSAPVPSQWTTYLRVGDIDIAAAAIVANGGRPLGRPVSIGALARTLVAVDPGGAFFGVWEPGDLLGSGVLDKPGSLTWSELLTRDYDRVLDFYENIFAHGFIDETEPDGPRWSTAHTGDGNPAYGLAEIEPDWPAEIPAHWLASLSTQHVVPTVARALELGATLLQGPFDGPYGLGAVLAGPEGEVFSVLVPDED